MAAPPHVEGSKRANQPCLVCGAPLTRHEQAAGPTCRKLACLTVIAVRAREEARLVREANVEAAFAWFAGRGETVAKAEIGVVPFIDRPIAAADRSRQALFRQNLAAAMAEAAALTAPPSCEPGPQDTVEIDAALAWGCAMCAGRCCHRGGTHAFLSAEELALKLAAAPETSPEAMLDAYFAALPERSAEGSCVFHGEEGCVLPRQARARICNEWLCAGLVDWARAMEGMSLERLNVASVENGVVRRSAVVDRGVAVDRFPAR